MHIIKNGVSDNDVYVCVIAVIPSRTSLRMYAYTINYSLKLGAISFNLFSP